MERTIVIMECAISGIYGDRIYYSSDLLEWATSLAPGMWGKYDKRISLDGEELFGFEYPHVTKALQMQEKDGWINHQNRCIDDVFQKAEENGFQILFASDIDPKRYG